MICSPSNDPQRSNSSANRKPTPRPEKPAHDDFVLLIPVIRRHARVSFRKVLAEAKEDLIEECVANAFRTYVRLIELNKQDLIYPTALAKFAVRQVRDGRRVGGRLNANDVLSRYAQVRKDIKMERLDRYDHEEREWHEAVIEDGETPVPDQVAFRMDFPAWLKQHKPPKRRVAEVLALGYTTSEAAKRFDLSSGRVSQMREEFAESWDAYQGEGAAAEEEALAVA